MPELQRKLCTHLKKPTHVHNSFISSERLITKDSNEPKEKTERPCLNVVKNHHRQIQRAEIYASIMHINISIRRVRVIYACRDCIRMQRAYITRTCTLCIYRGESKNRNVSRNKCENCNIYPPPMHNCKLPSAGCSEGVKQIAPPLPPCCPRDPFILSRFPLTASRHIASHPE